MPLGVTLSMECSSRNDGLGEWPPRYREDAMDSLRSALCALSLVFSVSAVPALATSFSTDQSDLYYIATESGWGMQLVQRGNVIFATLFVYGPDGSPAWYSATMSPAAVTLNWSGDLYATTGPWFGTVPFNPANVAATKVGTMTWNGEELDIGTVTYSINGVMVTKNVVRQTLVIDNNTGTYLGAIKYTAAACTNPATDTTVEQFAVIDVTQLADSTIIITSTDGTGTELRFSGTLTQAGQFGTIFGEYSSSTGDAGGFAMAEVNAQGNYRTARVLLNSSNFGCQSNGYLGGMRR
jgi:hypothetical protein